MKEPDPLTISDCRQAITQLLRKADFTELKRALIQVCRDEAEKKSPEGEGRLIWLKRAINLECII